MCHMPGSKLYGGDRYESGVIQECEVSVYEEMNDANRDAYEKALESKRIAEEKEAEERYKQYLIDSDPVKIAAAKEEAEARK